jgi:hypothetical protein
VTEGLLSNGMARNDMDPQISLRISRIVGDAHPTNIISPMYSPDIDRRYTVNNVIQMSFEPLVGSRRLLSRKQCVQAASGDRGAIHSAAAFSAS